MNRLYLLFTVICFSNNAQVVDSEVLDFNNISAVIKNNGSFFHNSQNGPGYEIPKGSGKRTIYASSIWAGAEDSEGNFYVSYPLLLEGQNIGRFRSGPISSTSEYQSSEYINEYGKSIWKVTKDDVNYHLAHYVDPGYVASPEILEWPGNGNASLGINERLAPYIDVNQDGVYSPLQGDYPEIRGDESVYVIINDDTQNTNDRSLGIEIHLMFYQYHTGNYLSNTTFLYTQVFNRGQRDYYNFRESIYLDADIGLSTDDYFGGDSLNSVAFFYNGDNYDENDAGQIGYGDNAPCQGVVSLSHNAESFGYYKYPLIYPNVVDNFFDTVIWNYMNSKWLDGTPWTVGGNGYDSTSSNPVTNYLYNGNPYLNEGWTEMNTNDGSGNSSSDRRGMLTIKEFEFLKGSSICADFAFVYGRSGTYLRNVQEVIDISAALRRLYAFQVENPCASANYIGLEEEGTKPEIKVYPNPAKDFLFLEFDRVEQRRIKLINTSGKVLIDFRNNDDKCSVKLSAEAGVYFITIESRSGIQTEKVIVQ